MLVEKLFCSFFNPLISLYIYYDQYEKIWRKNENNFFPTVHFHGTSNAVKSCTHIEDINEEMYTSVFSFVEYYIVNHFFCEKRKKN